MISGGILQSPEPTDGSLSITNKAHLPVSPG